MMRSRFITSPSHSLCFRFTFVIFIIALFGTLSYFSTLPDTPENHHIRRFLQDNEDSEECAQNDTILGFPKLDGNEWLFIFYLMGVLYMFIALAIVCDEYFVCALELIGEELDLSNDVAGATLMAAGGSAPELFTSLIGTFQETDIGFGTIVGSAVFNILFVIGMCAVYSKDELHLTWWPLARDVSYYALGLSLLSIFFSAHTKEELQWGESVLLFSFYLGYIFLMKNNRVLFNFVNKTFDLHEKDLEEDDINFNKHSMFRAGILSLLINEKSIFETVPLKVVTGITGDVKKTFQRFDLNGDGEISKKKWIKF
eukprot:UN29538